MESQRAENLKRLLAPKHIAFIGGADADYSARQCAKSFSGSIWGVNPKRDKLGGQPCFASVKELPEAPDAVFLATPKAAALEVVTDLAEMGAGGIVCFTAGYGETGADGRTDEKELIESAGNMAFVGPNCYGLINYVHNATLWPFGAGSCESETGVALIMQSGMIAADLAMNQRSVPISYVISAGNQAALAIEDYIDVMVDDPHVSGFGVYIEGIENVNRFAAASLSALKADKPIVLIKAGSSKIGAELAVSHTASLAGADAAHDAFFERLGIVRVYSPELMLEALKFMTVSGIPKGNRVAAFTCSGGEALMVADYCERSGLQLPQPSSRCFKKLEKLLPEIATVSNPLDYTTPLWGNTEIMPKVFAAALEDGFDSAVFIQDYPPESFDADSRYYRADGKSYMDAVNHAGIPAGICSELSENFDRLSREYYVDGGVTPMQGFDRGLDAIRLAVAYGERKTNILSSEALIEFECLSSKSQPLNPRLENEWQGKLALRSAGVPAPKGVLIQIDEIDRLQQRIAKLQYPLVVKLVSNKIPHKSELGAVKLNIENVTSATQAADDLIALLKDENLTAECQGILFEQMIKNGLCELLLGIKADRQFGLTMVLASGGVFVELLKDSVTFILPVTDNELLAGLKKLKCYPLLDGFRGNPACNLDSLVQNIQRFACFAQANIDTLEEVEINPMIVTRQGEYAADVLLRVVDRH